MAKWKVKHLKSALGLCNLYFEAVTFGCTKFRSVGSGMYTNDCCNGFSVRSMVLYHQTQTKGESFPVVLTGVKHWGDGKHRSFLMTSYHEETEGTYRAPEINKKHHLYTQE